MEDNNISEPQPQADAETESPPTRVETSAAEVAVTAASTDENPASNGCATEGEGEEAEDGVAVESGGTEAEVTVRRKRGRPRKHQMEENATLAISQDFSDSLTTLRQKRGRGRPRGTGKLQMLAALGGFAVDTAGGHFTPHAVTVQIGEDIVEKILSFAQRGPRAICVLSAVGPVSIVDIRPSGSFGGSILRYEGRFELLTLCGSHASNEMEGVRRKIGMLSVSLANPDGRVFGGAVAGLLVAAGPVQLILASFKQSIKKQLLRRHSAESSTAAAMAGDLDRVRVPTLIGRMANVEENCIVTPPFPFPEPPNGAENIISDQNVNHAPLHVFDQNASQPSDHTSDESVSDINGGVLEM